MVNTRAAGLTLIELVISIAILSILAGMAMPLAENGMKRAREVELRENLRRIRTGIDRYYDRMDREAPTRPEEEKYPKSMQDLVEKKILRRVPVDPITGKDDWIIISYTDKFDEEAYIINENPENLYDVRSRSEEVALDGTRYVSW
jgi:general secretion pathway protein G